MKRAYILIFISVLLGGCSTVQPGNFPVSQESIQSAFGDKQGCFILTSCSSGESVRFNPVECSEKLPPCSTFKIWNTLIAVENGLISSPEEPFYKWDGEIRAIPDWNKDLNLKEAFRVSCVPAFKDLARKIGPERMKDWIGRIGYGDQDISAGIDVFWLPAAGRKTILISPEEQTKLIVRLVTGKLPFNAKSLSILKEIMIVKRTDHGILYGKTGSAANDSGKYVMGWFVGYVESNGETYAFSCVVKGENLMGKDAKSIVETILEQQGFL